MRCLWLHSWAWKVDFGRLDAVVFEYGSLWKSDTHIVCEKCGKVAEATKPAHHALPEILLHITNC